MTVFRRSPKPIPAKSAAGDAAAPTGGRAHLAPRNSRLALEPRLLFDGAGAVAGVDAFDDAQQQDDAQHGPQEAGGAHLPGGGAMPFGGIGPLAAGDAELNAEEEPLSVAEPSANNAAGADTVTVDGWTLTGDGQVTVGVTLDDPAAGTLTSSDGQSSGNGPLSFTGSVTDARAWLNSLTFTAADTELGNEARTVKVTATVNGESAASRDITITPSNDPVTLDDTVITVTEGDSDHTITLTPVDPEVDLQPNPTQDASQIVYSLVNESDLPRHGYLTLDGKRLGVGSVFTQDDIDKGRLKYVHTAGGTADQNTADGFRVRVNDGATPLDESDWATITLNITPVNQDPVIGGSGVVYEGQPRNAVGTGSVGQYITGGTGGDPTDDLDDAVVTLTSLPPAANGGRLYFTGTATVGGVTRSYADHEITQADIDAGFSFLYSAKDGLSYSHDGRENVASDSFGVSITDQGGGTGTAKTTAGTVTLTIRPVDDDPVLGTDAHPDPTLEAHVPDIDSGEGHSVVLTPDMIGARDVDTNDKNLRFIVDYDKAVDLDHGHLQIKIGSDWLNIPPGESFSMQDIVAGNIRYIQTRDANPGDTDQFTFKVVDNTNALRWNPDGSSYDRIGGIYEAPGGHGAALKEHTFTIQLSDMAPGDGTHWNDLDRDPRHDDSTHAGIPDASNGKGELDEGKTIVLDGTGAGADAPYLTYTANGVEPDEVIYTFDGFIDDDSSASTAGELQKKVGPGDDDWVTLNRYDTFTQKDLNEGKIRFKHDGDSEKFVSKARFTVSAGLTVIVDGTPQQDIWTPTFTFFIKPENDAPTAAGSDRLVIQEGDTVYVTDQWLTIGDPDDAGSNTSEIPDLDSAEQRNGDTNFAIDHDDDHPLMVAFTEVPPEGGKLQRWDNAANDWVDVQVGDQIKAGDLKTAMGGGASGLRFVHDGSEIHTIDFKVQAIDRHGAASGIATVTIQVTNVNDAPRIAQKPNLPDPLPTDGSPSIIGTPSKNDPITVREGGEKAITKDELQAIDSDSSDRQVQYKITEAPKYGDILLNGKKLGVGSSFTQKDIADGNVKYVHRGAETPQVAGTDGYEDRFLFTLSDGDKEQPDNEFWIFVEPTNDPPEVTAPTSPQKTGDDGVNRIPGVSVSDKDLTAAIDDGEEDFIQVTVRLKDGDTVVTGGFTFGHGSPSDTGAPGDKWKSNDGAGGVLVLQGTRAQVNQALAGLSVTFAGDENRKYDLEVIADDRVRDANGVLENGANGGLVNQATTPGGTPGAIGAADYDWTSGATKVSDADPGNIASKTMEIWSSKVNDPPTLTVPGTADVHEDVRSRIPGPFDIGDNESAAFDTDVTVTITVPSGTLHIGSSGSADSVTPSGAGAKAVGVSGQGTGTLTLTGRAADIEALLNDTDASGGLYYTSAGNVNHDLNSGGATDAANGDVTISFKLTETEGGSAIGSGPRPELTGEINLTIIAVNDAPTVNAGSGQVIIDDAGDHSVGGISIGDPDALDGYAEGEEDGLIHVIVRLNNEDGTPLSKAEYEALGLKLGSTAGSSGATAIGGDEDALVLRGTREQINAYLAGLQVQFSKAANSNVDQRYLLEVIADDRLRQANGSLRDFDPGTGGTQPRANGGAQNQQNGLPAVPVKDDFNVHTTKVAEYGVFNVVAGTRELFVSSINDPGRIAGENATFDEGNASITLNDQQGKLQLDDSDHNGSSSMETTVTVTKGTITAVGAHSDKVTGLGTDSITIRNATQAQINAILASLTVTLPGADTAEKQNWNGQFDVTVVYNDKGNTGLRPDALTDDSNDPRSANGDYAYADPLGNDGDPANDNHLVTTRTITVTVNPVNDAPVVAGTGDATIPAATEDTDGADAARTIGDLFGGRFQDSLDQVDNSGAADTLTNGSDSDSFHGVAVVGNSAIASQGEWQYFDGTAWVTIPTDVADGKALILDKDTPVRFRPAADFHGTPGGLNVRLVETHDDAAGTADTTSSSVAARNPATGSVIDLTANGGVGGTSLYSAGAIALNTTVANVNDAPSQTGSATLDGTTEDSAGSPPASAADIAAKLTYSDATDDQSAIAGGGDEAGAQTAIAITGNDATAAQGRWQYTLDGGATWIDVPTDASDGKAIVLSTSDPGHQVRFVPAANFNGTPGGLTVRGADDTWTGSAGEQNLGGVIGGTHPWSQNSGTVGITVAPANDAPDFTHLPSNPAVAEDGTTGGGTSVPPTRLLGGGTVSDIDLPTTPDLDEDVFGAGAITVKLTDGGFPGSGDVLRVDGGLPGIASVTGGANGNDLVITLSETATKDQVAAILAAIEYLNTSDNPTNFGANETRDYSVTLSDGKNGQGGGKDAGSGPAMEKTVSGTITITAANDPPVATDNTNTVEETSTVGGNLITDDDGNGTDSDPDTPVADLKISHIQPKDAPSSTPLNPGGPTVVDGKHGKLTVHPDGSYTYTPNPGLDLDENDTLTDEFTYTVSDGDGGSSDAKLTITIEGVDDPVSVDVPQNHPGSPAAGDTSDHVVFERGLPGGSSPNTADRTVDSHFVVSAPDGLRDNGAVTIDYTDENGNPQTLTLSKPEVEALGSSNRQITTEHGTLTLDGYTRQPDGSIKIDYTYTLNQPSDTNSAGNDATDGFQIRAYDVDGDTDAPQSLTIRIVDDGPRARPDANEVRGDANGNYPALDGNVYGNDSPGADGPDATGPVTGIRSDNTGGTPGAVGSPLDGEYGTLTLNADGSYTYVVNTSHPDVAERRGPLTEVYTYTITDANGDVATATLTITISAMEDPPVTAPPSDPFRDTGIPRMPDIRNPFLSSAVGDDPSPYFYGDTFDRLPRMDLPFHPVVYVNREVERSQFLREHNDTRGEGDAGLIEGARGGQRLSSQRLAMEHVLYVQNAVRTSSSLSEHLAARVDGHRSHLNLSGDGRQLPAPELFGADVLGWPFLKGKRPAAAPDAPGDGNAAPQEQGREQAAPADGQPGADLRGSAAFADALAAAEPAEDALALEGAQAIAAAPSFSEQLRGGRGALPGALHAPHDLI